MTNVYVWGSAKHGQLNKDCTEKPILATPELLNLPLSSAINNGGGNGGAATIIKVAYGLQHTVILLNTGDILSFGTNEYNQLGHDKIRAGLIKLPSSSSSLSSSSISDSSQLSEQKDKQLEKKVFFVDIFSGLRYNIAVDAQGRLYSWGCNDRGQLGDSGGANGSIRLVRTLAGDKHSSLSSGGLHSLLPRLQHRVVQVGCGSSHVLALCASSQLWAWGDNKFGQLGLATSNSAPPTFSVNSVAVATAHSPRLNYLEPQRVITLDSLPIRVVAVGAHHSMVATVTGSAYAWGCNSAGQLGLGTQPDNVAHPSPALIRSLKQLQLRVVHIVCGEQHSVMLTRCGNVFACGDGRYGQLGNGQRQQSVITPQSIADKTSVTQIAAGLNHTLIYVRSHGKIYAFGMGGEGQLGTGYTTDSLTPSLTKGDWQPPPLMLSPTNSNNKIASKSRPQIILKLFSGLGNHSAILSTNATASDGKNNLLAVNPSDSTDVANRSDQFLLKICFSQSSSATAKTNQSAPTNNYQQIYIFDNAFIQKWQAYHQTNKSSDGGVALTEHILTVYSSLACLASSFGAKLDASSYQSRLLSYSDDPIDFRRQGTTPIPNEDPIMVVSRQNHGLDLDLAHNFQAQLFEKSDATLKNQIKFVLQKYVLEPYQHRVNYPDVETLRGFLVIGMSPFMESVEYFEDIIYYYCSAINSMHRIPASLIDSWWSISKPRHIRKIVSNLLNCTVNFIDLWKNVENVQRKTTEEGLKVLLDTLARFYKITESNAILPYTIFYIPDLNKKVNLEVKFREWREAKNQQQKNSGTPPPPSLSIPRRPTASSSSASASSSSASSASVSASATLSKASISPETAGAAASSAASAAFTSINYEAIAASSWFSFCNYPFIMDADAKHTLLKTEAECQMTEAMRQAQTQLIVTMMGVAALPIDSVSPILLLTVRREFLIEDTIQILRQTESGNLKKPLRIKFYGEEAIDEGGVLKEFFMLSIRAILDPNYSMFRTYEQSQMCWFSETTFETDEMFFTIGQICGLAIYNNMIVDLHFPLAMFKKLLDEEVGLDDFKELDPVNGKSLEALLHFEGDENEFDDVFGGMTFEISWDSFGERVTQNLCEEDDGRPQAEWRQLTRDNREEYVRLYVDYVLNKRVRVGFTQFYAGFQLVMHGHSVRMFKAIELKELVTGSENIDWDELKRNCEYKGEYWAGHPVIRWFWDALRSLNLAEKKQFLRFLTGCDRVPVLGSQLRIAVQPTRGGDAYLPVAHTCANLLDLPMYTNYQILLDKLKLAIQQNEGFSLV